MNPHIYRLSVVHRWLDRKIRTELRNAGPDWVRLLRLTKLPLAIKDRFSGEARRTGRA